MLRARTAKGAFNLLQSQPTKTRVYAAAKDTICGSRVLEKVGLSAYLIARRQLRRPTTHQLRHLALQLVCGSYIFTNHRGLVKRSKLLHEIAFP